MRPIKNVKKREKILKLLNLVEKIELLINS
jgi:hypothetical protein